MAATNIGLGARTLTDLFRLAKLNNASGELNALDDQELKDFCEDPVALPPTLSLLHREVMRGTREAKMASLGLRKIQEFITVVRLRRVHRQAGASLYKESLLRTRDGAMTQGDHALWRTHTLNDLEDCSLTPEERARFEDGAPPGRPAHPRQAWSTLAGPEVHVVRTPVLKRFLSCVGI